MGHINSSNYYSSESSPVSSVVSSATSSSASSITSSSVTEGKANVIGFPLTIVSAITGA